MGLFVYSFGNVERTQNIIYFAAQGSILDLSLWIEGLSFFWGQRTWRQPLRLGCWRWPGKLRLREGKCNLGATRWSGDGAGTGTRHCRGKIRGDAAFLKYKIGWIAVKPEHLRAGREGFQVRRCSSKEKARSFPSSSFLPCFLTPGPGRNSDSPHPGAWGEDWRVNTRNVLGTTPGTECCIRLSVCCYVIIIVPRWPNRWTWTFHLSSRSSAVGVPVWILCRWHVSTPALANVTWLDPSTAYFRPHFLKQGSPSPRLPTGTGRWPDRNRAAQQEVSSGRSSKASTVFTAAPHQRH